MLIGVWRSLVARMNGVHEVASSTLVTQTKSSITNGYEAFELMEIKINNIIESVNPAIRKKRG